MALTVAGYNPIKVTGTTAAAEAVETRRVYVKFVQWHKPTTAGHLLSMTDTAGNQKANAHCDANDESQSIPVFCWCDGLKIDDMDSGTVLIYIQDNRTKYS